MGDTNDGPVFRAHKRRKVFRKRADEDDDNDADTITPTGPAAVADGDKDGEVEAEAKETAAVQRLRKPAATRKRGVGFTSTSESRRLGGDSGATSANNTDAPGTPLSAVEHAQARFVAPTGHIASSDDKHM